jgi:hypothetical protein
MKPLLAHQSSYKEAANLNTIICQQPLDCAGAGSATTFSKHLINLGFKTFPHCIYHLLTASIAVIAGSGYAKCLTDLFNGLLLA